jgi:glycosyltransferase involved in cell wall biosynthesis
MNIQILLSTYNGEKYLRELLDSILVQTYQDWCLLVRDDGSSDGTKTILHEYASGDCRISILDSESNVGVISSFEILLKESTAPYVMFCDQDDVWFPTKVSDQLDAMLECEGCHVNTPIVVHSDLLVVDSDLNLISNSFWKYSNINIQQRDFNFLGVKNIVTGCAMMLNRRAIDCSLPFKPETRMHDAWIVLNVLKSGGQLVSMETPTIKYRQHDNNVVGAVVQGNIFRNKILKICTVIKENREQWKMLKIIGYGSLFKYFYFKLRSCINT